MKFTDPVECLSVALSQSAVCLRHCFWCFCYARLLVSVDLSGSSSVAFRFDVAPPPPPPAGAGVGRSLVFFQYLYELMASSV